MADAKSLFQVIIEAVDHLSAPFEKMEQRVKAFNAPIREIGERFEHLGEVSGIDKVGEAFHNLGEKIGHAGELLLEFAGPLAALGAVGSIAGLVETAIKVSETGERIHDAAIKIGIDAESLQKLDFAGKLNSVAPEAMEKGLTKLNRVLGDSAAGQNKQAANMFRHLGIQIKDAKGHVLDAAQVLPALSDALKRNTDPAVRTRIAMMAFSRAGAEMLPMLVQGSGKLKQWGIEAEKAGILTNKQVNQAKEFADKYTILRNSIDGVVNSIGAALLPVLQPLVEKVTAWVQANRELIATKVHNFIDKVATALEKIDWSAVENGAKGLLRFFGGLIDKVGGVENAMIGFGLLMAGPLIAAFLGIGTALIGLGWQLTVVAAKFVLFPVASLVGDFLALIPAIAGATDVFAALDIAMAANPIGVVVLAVGALIGVGYELYQHWDTIKVRLSNAWSLIAANAKTAWDQVTGTLRGAWDSITGIFESAWARIKPIIDAVTDNAVVRALEHAFSSGAPAAVAAGALAIATPNLPSYSGSGFGIDQGSPQSILAPPAQTGRAADPGAVHVKVDFMNVPPNVRVNTVTQGPVEPVTNVGYSMRPIGQ